MGRREGIFYWGVLAFCLALAITSALLELWAFVGLALLFGAMFFFTGWFVLARAWRLPEPRLNRRPVRRRRSKR